MFIKKLTLLGLGTNTAVAFPEVFIGRLSQTQEDGLRICTAHSSLDVRKVSEFPVAPKRPSYWPNIPLQTAADGNAQSLRAVGGTTYTPSGRLYAADDIPHTTHRNSGASASCR